MPLLKRRTTREAEIPTSSMADIAFLLLIFFLVTTTIDVDTGIYMELPPKLEDEIEPPIIKERNILNVLVNQRGDVLVDGRPTNLRGINAEIVKHVTNEGRDPDYSERPALAIVSFKTERQARYDMYVTVLDEIKVAYRDIHDQESRRYGAADYATYRERLGGGEDLVRDKYPVKISLAEPDATQPSTGG